MRRHDLPLDAEDAVPCAGGEICAWRSAHADATPLYEDTITGHVYLLGHDGLAVGPITHCPWCGSQVHRGPLVLVRP